MCRGRAIACPLAQTIEDFLQLGASGDYDPDLKRPQLEQKPKVTQVTIKERIFVIPFHLDANLVLKTIYFV